MGVLVVRAFLSAQGVVAAHVLGHLHLNHIGTPIGQLTARGRASSDLRQVNDAKSGQGSGSGLVGHVLSFLNEASKMLWIMPV